MDNYAVTLFRRTMMLAVMDIIVENVPELTAPDLSDNTLYVLDSLSALAVKVPNLRVLHIGRNQVSYCIQSEHAYTSAKYCLTFEC
jgi:Leucine-rich repeat (LRR) protein